MYMLVANLGTCEGYDVGFVDSVAVYLVCCMEYILRVLGVT